MPEFGSCGRIANQFVSELRSMIHTLPGVIVDDRSEWALPGSLVFDAGTCAFRRDAHCFACILCPALYNCSLLCWDSLPYTFALLLCWDMLS